MRQRLLLLAAVVVTFAIGYGTAAQAWPGVADRDRWHGYFKNREDSVGVDVFPGGFPGWVNSADEFIDFMKCRLNGREHDDRKRCVNSSIDDQNRIGAAFIIDTMLSDGAPTSYVRNLPPTAAQVADWESRVRQAERDGLVDFKVVDFSYRVNSYYQDDVGGSPRGDVAFYYKRGLSDVIIFKNRSGDPIYVIRRECANPLGTLRGLPRASDFESRPVVTPNPATAQQGETVRFTYTIHNSGATATRPTSCARVAINRPAGYTPLPQQDAGRATAAPYGACPIVVPAHASRQVGSEVVVVGGQPPGSKICRSLVIDPRNEGGGPRSSAEACVTIAKSPYAHFMGNDVWAGGNFADISPACSGLAKIHTSSRALVDGSLAGSVSEYGAFALGTVTEFGSASKPFVNPASSVGKAFTFANTGAAPGSFGATSHCINDYLVRFANVAVSSQPPVLDVGARGSGVWRVNGNRTLRGTVPNGAQQVYIVQNGAVTIDNNLRYSGNYSNLSDIPSLVVISTCTIPAQCAVDANAHGQIRINSNVEQVDGLFIAKNVFNTCAEVPDPLHVGVCNRQLTVNGAVVARELRLKRTFGADGATPAARKQPAEVFNFTTEMYLRSALQQSNRTTVETIDTRELPPRF